MLHSLSNVILVDEKPTVLHIDIKYHRLLISCQYSKNPCSCGNHTFPRGVIRTWQTWGHRYHAFQDSLMWSRAASCLPGPDDAPSLQMCDFHMSMDSCFYPTTCNLDYTKHQNNCVKIAHFHTHILSAWIVFWSWDKRHFPMEEIVLHRKYFRYYHQTNTASGWGELIEEMMVITMVLGW